jgi:hypothetical protein
MELAARCLLLLTSYASDALRARQIDLTTVGASSRPAWRTGVDPNLAPHV